MTDTPTNEPTRNRPPRFPIERFTNLPRGITAGKDLMVSMKRRFEQADIDAVTFVILLRDALADARAKLGHQGPVEAREAWDDAIAIADEWLAVKRG